MNRKLLSRICVILLSFAMLSGCVAYNNFVDSFFKGDEDTIKIGVFEPLSGSYAKYGTLEREGIELAHELYPEVEGKTVRLVFADNESDIGGAREAAENLLKEDVVMVLGSYDSTLSIAGGEIFQESGIPAIAITNTNPVVTDAFDIYCRICPVESDQGFAAASYAADRARAGKAAVLKEKNNDFSETLTTNFIEEFTEKTGASGDDVMIAEYDSDQTDFSEQLKDIAAFGAKVVFCPGSWQTGILAMTEAGSMNFTAEFIGTDAWRTEGILHAYDPETMPPMAFTTYYDENANITEMSSVFLEAYREKYGEDSGPDPAVALAFDAYLIALESIRTATAANAGAVLTALRNTGAFAGASGEITFDDRGDPIKPIMMTTAADGKFVAIDSVKLDKKKGN
jgi:branched-chain amino acid transport system substrate-binding protein